MRGPLARQRGLVVKAVGDELLVYDLERHRAHSLNASAGAVWRLCDGTRTAAEIAVAARGPGLPLSAEAVSSAIAALWHARLLDDRGAGATFTRRRLIGTTAAALPLVLSIVTPSAAQAQSVVCVDNGQTCGSDAECCGGLCAPPNLCFCNDQTNLCFGLI
jgi:hypothetical protein